MITAAGKGARMGVEGGKQFIALGGVPMLAHAVRAFEESSAVSQIVIVVDPENMERCRTEIVEAFGFEKVVAVAAGGDERQASVFNGLKALPSHTQAVAIHDGARPLVTPQLIEECFAELPGADGVIPAVPIKDTPKLVYGNIVGESLDRALVRAAQTPQVFLLDVARRAHERAHAEGFLGTDDASLVQRIGGRVKVVDGSEENLKITTPFDLLVAEAILKARK